MEPPIGLLEIIVMRVHKEERILVLRRFVFFSLLFIGSTAAFIPSFNMLGADFKNSGFLSFFSLLFSDFSIVTTYWKSFILTLLETLPFVSIALFLAVLLTFLESARFLSRDVKKIIKTRAVA